MSHPIAPQVLDKLRTFDTPTICNLIELFQVRPDNTGYMDARIKACFPELPPIVGFAATATFRAAAPAQQRDGYAGIEVQLEHFAQLSGPPVVVFQDLDDPPVAATFGEIMCTAYRAFGAVGLITSGAGRDLEQVRALRFPVFTSGAICSHGYNLILQVHVPVRVGGLTVHPDDLLHGDLNGVTSIPRAIVSELADVGDEFVAAEKLVLDVLHTPGVSLTQLQEARAEQRARIQALRRRVARSRH